MSKQLTSQFTLPLPAPRCSHLHVEVFDLGAAALLELFCLRLFCAPCVFDGVQQGFAFPHGDGLLFTKLLHFLFKLPLPLFENLC